MDCRRSCHAVQVDLILTERWRIENYRWGWLLRIMGGVPGLLAAG